MNWVTSIVLAIFFESVIFLEIPFIHPFNPKTLFPMKPSFFPLLSASLLLGTALSTMAAPLWEETFSGSVPAGAYTPGGKVPFGSGTGNRWWSGNDDGVGSPKTFRVTQDTGDLFGSGTSNQFGTMIRTGSASGDQNYVGYTFASTQTGQISFDYWVGAGELVSAVNRGIPPARHDGCYRRQFHQL